MKFKSTWALLLIAIAMGAYVYFIEIKKADKDATAKAEAEKILNFDSQNVKEILVDNSHGHFDIAGGNHKWTLKSPTEDAADDATVTEFLNELGQEKYDQVVSENGADLASFGLDKPKEKVTLVMKDGTSKALWVGMDGALPGKVYVTRPEDKKVLFANLSIKTNLDKDQHEWRDKRLLRVDRNDIQQITIVSHDPKKPANITLVKDQKDKNVWRLGTSNEKADNDTVVTFMNALEGLRAAEFLAPDKKQGLAHPSTVITVTGKDGKELVTLKFSAEKDGKVYSEVSGVDSVLSVYSSSMSGIQKTADDFKDKRAPFDINKEDVAEIQISSDLSHVHLIKKGSSWQLAVPEPDKDVAQVQVSNFFDKLSLLKVADYPKEAAQGLHPPKGTVELKDAKGHVLLTMHWGGKVKGANQYFVDTSLAKKPFAVDASLIEGMPKQTLVVEKASKAPRSDGNAPEKSSSNEQGQSKGAPL